jgi:hypothetical protein
MGYVSNLTRKIVFWNYPRTSWQWDVLCVLILIFIFLTPKTWFTNTAYQHSHPLNTVVIKVIGGKPDKIEAERQAKEAAGNPNATISDTREVKDQTGKVLRYEVDIR